MVSLNGQMGNYFSLFGICFFVHAIALVLLLAYLLAKRQTLRFAGAPWYVYLVGVMGIAIVASSSWCTLHVGASAFMALSTAGQLVSSALIDRFGLFGMPVTRIRKRQLPGVRAGAAGRASGRSELREGCKMIYYLTALINGFFNSVNRMTNVRAGKLFGTANGALINYVEATVLSLLLMLVLKNGKELSWGYIVSVPWWVYLGSICGLLAQLLQIVRDAALEHARFVNSHAGRQSGDVADARLRVLRNVPVCCAPPASSSFWPVWPWWKRRKRQRRRLQLKKSNDPACGNKQQRGCPVEGTAALFLFYFAPGYRHSMPCSAK